MAPPPTQRPFNLLQMPSRRGLGNTPTTAGPGPHRALLPTRVQDPIEPCSPTRVQDQQDQLNQQSQSSGSLCRRLMNWCPETLTESSSVLTLASLRERQRSGPHPVKRKLFIG
ncbi:hypothetical protein EYF80_060822 [Liparis tanakae]|uniref:Uncharacterized protein n=1 Tax=Liparis tanakae TaxID=230148 RepID=A0A4Z2EKY7_9TELE|nr:hypothetical protein EYF80_060822 [Liparis tanakae]